MREHVFLAACPQLISVAGPVPHHSHTKGIRDNDHQRHRPPPNAFKIEAATRENDNYRVVAWTGRHLQVTLMTIPVGESIGLEAHPDTDQFLRIGSGHGKAVMGPPEDQLDFEQAVSDGSSIQVPAGMWHDVINTGDEPFRLCAIDAPSHHAAGAVQATSTDAANDELAGDDEAPSWTVQPAEGQVDEHAWAPGQTK